MDYPSPRGVHVPETYYASDADDDPYRRPSHRNRYSRSVHQTPRIRDVTWISSPDPTPQTPYAPPTPWLPAPHVPSTPAHRPPSTIPPSPAPTVGEHMTVDDIPFTQYDFVDPYRPPQRPSLIKSFWKGLKKLGSGFQPAPSFHMPRPSSYMDQTAGVSAPGRAPSEATQYDYVNQTPYASPYARPASVGATPAAIPGSLRASPVPVPSMEFPPPITVVSPSIPPSPLPNSIRSARFPSPAPRHLSVASPSIPPSPLPSSIRSARLPSSSPRHLSVGMPEPTTEEGSQTLHEPVYADPALDLQLTSAPIAILASDEEEEEAKFPLPPSGSGMQPLAVERSSSKGSLSSTMARFRRFVAELDDLPWVSDAQIADEYVPDMNPRSRLRTRMRQGAEPSWYNPRPEVVERPEFLSEWDKWANQSTGLLWAGDGCAVRWGGVGAGGLGQGQLGVVHPHGYVPVQPGFVYPSGFPPPGMVNDQGHAPVIP